MLLVFDGYQADYLFSAHMKGSSWRWALLFLPQHLFSWANLKQGAFPPPELPLMCCDCLARLP
jgi:hypothetical protein